MRHMYRREGAAVFFRGLIPPLVSVGGLNSIVFGTYAATARFLNHGSEDEIPTHTHVLVAGLVAGFISSIAVAPVELLRCRAQAKLTPEQAKIELNPITCARHIVKVRGVSGLFTGFVATTLRETPSMGIFFLSYETLCRRWGVREVQPENMLDMATFLKLNLAGGIAGMTSWFTYPFDVIKSRIQTQSLTEPEYKGVTDCARKIMRVEGYRGLFRGLLATVVQAFPVSAVTFAAYEVTILMMRGD